MFGWDDLKRTIAISEQSVECPVNACQHVVARQRGDFMRRGQFQCPEHRIFISPSTFEYEHERDNMLWSSPEDLALWKHIQAPGSRRDRRLARDNSVDAVTWNVFRYLETRGRLGSFVDRVYGAKVAEAPQLIWWSCCGESRGAWKPLLDAARAFGEDADRGSAPDLIIDDKKVLVFVESGLTGEDAAGPAEASQALGYERGCGRWYRKVFAVGSTYQVVAMQERLHELMRLWLIGSWIADSMGKSFVLVNLVRAEAERDIEERFGQHIISGDNRRFVRWTWELIQVLTVQERAGDADADKLLEFFGSKTLGYQTREGATHGELRRAFAR